MNIKKWIQEIQKIILVEIDESIKLTRHIWIILFKMNNFYISEYKGVTLTKEALKKLKEILNQMEL